MKWMFELAVSVYCIPLSIWTATIWFGDSASLSRAAQTVESTPPLTRTRTLLLPTVSLIYFKQLSFRLSIVKFCFIAQMFIKKLANICMPLTVRSTWNAKEKRYREIKTNQYWIVIRPMALSILLYILRDEIERRRFSVFHCKWRQLHCCRKLRMSSWSCPIFRCCHHAWVAPLGICPPVSYMYIYEMSGHFRTESKCWSSSSCHQVVEIGEMCSHNVAQK